MIANISQFFDEVAGRLFMAHNGQTCLAPSKTIARGEREESERIRAAESPT